MSKSRDHLVRIVGGVAALCLGVGLAVVASPTTPAFAATATILKETQWSTGYVGRVTVYNDTADPLPSWRVEFQLPPGTAIVTSWPTLAVIAPDNRYVFTSQPGDAGLAPGASTSVGFVANGTGSPGSCTVNSAPCSGAPAALEADRVADPEVDRPTG